MVCAIYLLSLAAAAAAAGGKAGGENPREDADIETSGIEEELAARARRSSRTSSRSSMSGGNESGNQPLAGGGAGLIGGAPDMAKVRRTDGLTAFLLM